jgi:hypothetical protein
MSEVQLSEPSVNLVHNRTGYVRGCRCHLCVSGNKEYQRSYMKQWRNKRKVSSIASSL